MAIIPFFSLFYSLFISYQAPAFTDQLDNSLTVEVVENDQPKGIYFVSPETTFGQLLKTAGIGDFLYPDFKLNDGMKITINSASEKNDIIVTKIANAERLALGMPLDINKVTGDDLLLVKGIGEATAKKNIRLT